MIWCSQDLRTLLWRRVAEETVCGTLPISEVRPGSQRVTVVPCPNQNQKQKQFACMHVMRNIGGGGAWLDSIFCFLGCGCRWSLGLALTCTFSHLPCCLLFICLWPYFTRSRTSRVTMTRMALNGASPSRHICRTCAWPAWRTTGNTSVRCATAKLTARPCVN